MGALVSFNAIRASLILAQTGRHCINILLYAFSSLIYKPGEYNQFVHPSEASSEETSVPLTERMARRMRIKPRFLYTDQFTSWIKFFKIAVV